MTSTCRLTFPESGKPKTEGCGWQGPPIRQPRVVGPRVGGPREGGRESEGV